MKIIIKYLNEFLDDFKKFSDNDKTIVRKAINTLSKNPFSKDDGGFGKLLQGDDGKGLFCVKILFANIRIVYYLFKGENYIFLLFVGVNATGNKYYA